MFNPCDLVFTRTPQVPSLKDGGELVIQTVPVEERTTIAPPQASGPADRVMPMANPLAAAAGDLEHMRAEPDVASELDRSLPALAQTVLDLIARTSPVLDTALSAIAPRRVEDEERYQAQGGRVGRGPSGDALAPPPRGARPPRPVLPPLPPLATAPAQPVLDLVPPLEAVTIDLDQVAELAPPPSPRALAETRQEALSSPWSQREGDRLRQEAPAHVAPARVRLALRQLSELESFAGGALRMANDGAFEGFPVTDREGFQRLAAMTTFGQPTPVGTYLVALRDVYMSYKVDYYGLLRSRRAMLDRRDPASLIPLATEDEIRDYLWRKYGEALRGLLWRLVRTSTDLPEAARRLLGSDRPWLSGGELTPDLARAGVFVALASDEGDLELHKDQGNPWGAEGVFNLAVAVRIGRDVVAYDVRSGVLKINGRVAPWSHGVHELPEGGRLELGDERLQVVSRRGDTVDVKLAGRTLLLSGSVSGDRPAGSVKGALGTFGAAEVAEATNLLDWQVAPGASLL